MSLREWVLLNLGIEPVINQEVNVINEETGKEKKFKLVGSFIGFIWKQKIWSVRLIYGHGE